MYERFEGVPSEEIDMLIKYLVDLKKRRASENSVDLMSAASKKLWPDSSWRNQKPIMMRGQVVAVPGYIKHYSIGSGHKCCLCTLTLPESPESWAWEDSNESLIEASMTRVGQISTSVSLHTAVPGMLITQHKMVHAEGRHERQKRNVWRVVGEPGNLRLAVANDVPATRLPAPHDDMED